MNITSWLGTAQQLQRSAFKKLQAGVYADVVGNVYWLDIVPENILYFRLVKQLDDQR